MLVTVVVFLVILSILVLVHEFGHFIVGKLAGIGVLEFALGLPFTKPLWSKKLKSGMRLSLYPVLFGGFVKLLGEEGPADAKALAGEAREETSGKYFYRVNVWQRIAVVVAGVGMNFLLAVVAFYLFLGVSNFLVLVPKLSEYSFISPHETKVVVTLVQKDSPAKEAGLKPGDVIVEADGRRVDNLVEFQKYTKSRAGYPVKLTLSDVTFSQFRGAVVTPRMSPPKGQGAIGVAIGEGILVQYRSFPERVLAGLSYSVDMLIYNLRTLAHLIFSAFKTGNAAPLAESVSGPVGIASAVGTILDLGGKDAVVGLLNFLGLLSLSLAFMNILPIPALDGGRLAFLLVEAFFGKKLAAKNENLVNQVGMALLLGLILLISYNDLAKLLRR